MTTPPRCPHCNFNPRGTQHRCDECQTFICATCLVTGVRCPRRAGETVELVKVAGQLDRISPEQMAELRQQVKNGDAGHDCGEWPQLVGDKVLCRLCDQEIESRVSAPPPTTLQELRDVVGETAEEQAARIKAARDRLAQVVYDQFLPVINMIVQQPQGGSAVLGALAMLLGQVIEGAGPEHRERLTQEAIATIVRGTSGNATAPPETPQVPEPSSVM